MYVPPMKESTSQLLLAMINIVIHLLFQMYFEITCSRTLMHDFDISCPSPLKL